MPRWNCGCSAARAGGKITWQVCGPDHPDPDMVEIAKERLLGTRAAADVAPPEDDDEEPETAGRYALSVGTELRWHKGQPPLEPLPEPLPARAARPPKPKPPKPSPDPLPERQCSECTAMFRPSRRWQAACGDDCSTARARRRMREQYQAKHPPRSPRASRPTACKLCGGALITDNPTKRRRAGLLCEPCFDGKVAAQMLARREAAGANHR